MGETFGEAVFATGMSGYQETLTDPSYHRQVVVATAPHIGNTGWNDEDDESSRIWVAGYVVRDAARVPSSWRSRRSSGRRAAGPERGRHVRRGYPRHHPSPPRARGDAGRRLQRRDRPGRPAGAGPQPAGDVRGASWPTRSPPAQTYAVPAAGETRFRVVAVDLGIKSMTPHRMAERGIEVHVVPATATIDQVLALEPDGVFFSNGPGDPGRDRRAGRPGQGDPRGRDPVLRHLLRQPAVRPGAGLRHLQARLRAPRASTSR